MRPEKERLFAESLFVCEGKSCREIAGILPIDKLSAERRDLHSQGGATEQLCRLAALVPQDSFEIAG